MSLSLTETEKKHFVAAAMSLTSKMDWDMFEKNIKDIIETNAASTTRRTRTAPSAKTGTKKASPARNAWYGLKSSLKKLQETQNGEAPAANADFSIKQMDLVVAAIASSKYGDPKIDIEEFRRNAGCKGSRQSAQSSWNKVKQKASHHHRHIAPPIAPINQKKNAFAQNIEVLVGGRETPFDVFKGAITSRSGFFKTALGADITTVRLPDFRADHFEAYLNILWVGEIGAPAGGDQVSPTTHLDHLIGVYIVAAKLKDPMAQNQINSEIVKKIDTCQPSKASFDAVYAIREEAADTSLLREILVDNMVEWPVDQFRKVLPRGDLGGDLKDDCLDLLLQKRDILEGRKRKIQEAEVKVEKDYLIKTENTET